MTSDVFKSMADKLIKKQRPVQRNERPKPINQSVEEGASDSKHIGFDEYTLVHGSAAGWVTEEAKRQFEAGRKYVLMEVVFICASMQFVLPDWAVDALLDIHDRLNNGEYGDFTEAFGPLPQGKPGRKRRGRHLNQAGAVVQWLGMLRVGEAYNLGRDDLEIAAQRMRGEGLDVSNDDVREIYRKYGQGLKSIEPAEGKDFSSFFGSISLSERRRRGRPLADD